MKKGPIVLLIVGLLVAAGIAFAVNNNRSQLEPTDSAEIQLPDFDGDGMSDWFEENVAYLDPRIPNDRYAIILDTNTIHPNPKYTQERRQGVANFRTFFIEAERFEPENVFSFADKEATYENFKNAIDRIAGVSDENDLVYVILNGHGSERSFSFHTGKDPSEFEVTITDEIVGWYSPGTSLDTIIMAQKILHAAWGENITLQELNEVISEINYGQMLLVLTSCGGNRVIDKLLGENRVVIAPGCGIDEVLISTVVSPYVFDESGFYDFNLEDSDGNCYPSAREVFETLRNSPVIKSLIESDPNSVVIHEMSDQQGLAENFYFGDAKID